MIQILLLLFLTFLSIFSGSYIAHFAYVRSYVKKPWKLKIDRNFRPKISILIPVHNEEDTIESKLRNIKDVSYPRESIEVIVADDASEDNTFKKVEDFVENNPELNTEVARENSPAGKSTRSS